LDVQRRTDPGRIADEARSQFVPEVGAERRLGALEKLLAETLALTRRDPVRELRAFDAEQPRQLDARLDLPARLLQFAAPRRNVRRLFALCRRGAEFGEPGLRRLQRRRLLGDDGIGLLLQPEQPAPGVAEPLSWIASSCRSRSIVCTDRRAASSAASAPSPPWARHAGASASRRTNSKAARMSTDCRSGRSRGPIATRIGRPSGRR